MITLENIPAGFEPYPELVFCSNTILGGGHIFAIGSVLPLLIGKGPSPRIWLQAVASPSGRDFVLIVSDSKSVHPAVDSFVDGKRVVVSVRGRVVLAAEAVNEQRAVVTEADFRPLGLDVFGSSEGLGLGGMKLSNNTMSGVGVAFGLGA